MAAMTQTLDIHRLRHVLRPLRGGRNGRGVRARRRRLRRCRPRQRSSWSCAAKDSTTPPSAPRSTKRVTRRRELPSPPERVRLDIDGMTCASCATRVEKKLSRVEGVEGSSVNYATEEATVVYDPKHVEVDDLLEAVSAAGYCAHVHGEAVARKEPIAPPARRRARAHRAAHAARDGAAAPVRRVGVGGAGARHAGRALGGLAVPPRGRPQRPPRRGRRWTRSSRSARSPPGRGRPSSSLAGIEADTYFEVGAVITTLILVGRYLEERAKSRAGAAAARAARARRKGGARAPGRRGGARSDRTSCRSATCSSSGPERRSRPTGSSRTARRPWTSRC